MMEDQNFLWFMAGALLMAFFMLVLHFLPMVRQWNKDTERLSFLDRRCSPIVEGQTESWPYGEHVANGWGIQGPFANVRDAIDSHMGSL